MYAFARRPAWLLSHVLVFLLIVALANLGTWQLRRHDERAARNALVEARTEQPAVPVEELLDADPDDVRFRIVELAGGALQDEAVLIDNRSLDGRPGAWYVTPFVLASGTTVLLNHGFVAFESGLDIAPRQLPGGQPLLASHALVEVDAGRDCGTAASDQPGIVARHSCVDLEQIAADFGLTEAPPFELRKVPNADAELLFGVGPVGNAPATIPLPPLDGGPHRAYAAQWFIFMTIAIFGYPLVLRRVARTKDLPNEIDREIQDLFDAPA